MISQTAIGVQFIFGNTVGTVLARIAFTRRLNRYGRKRSVLKDYSMLVMRFRRRFACQMCFVQLARVGNNDTGPPAAREGNNT